MCRSGRVGGARCGKRETKEMGMTDRKETRGIKPVNEARKIKQKRIERK